MKTKTKQKQLLTKKQQEFYTFVSEKVMPLFEERNTKFDVVNPPLLQDEWNGKDILVMIPYGDRMEPWLTRVINECYADVKKTITVIMGAKVNTNAWHKFVFPFASEIAFVRRGKRPTAIVTYSDRCYFKVFNHAVNDTIAYTVDETKTGINKEMIANLLKEDIEE